MEKLNHKRYKDADAATVAVVAKNDSQEKPPPYLKVIADCWEHIFDYLSFHDILVMGQTCKRMTQMAGYYVREYYPQLHFQLIEKEVRFGDVCLHADFYRFIGYLTIFDVSTLEFLSNVKSFDALKKIIFAGLTLNGTQIENMQNMLKNVESIQLISCQITGNTFEQFANYCPKLKQLKSFGSETNGAMFSHYYPTLECLEFTKLKCQRMVGLKMFLEKHTNLKQFQIDYHLLWAHRAILKQTNIQLDLLIVDYNRSDRTVPFDQFINLLKTLHERGFYKALQLPLVFCDNGTDHEQLNNALSSLPALEKLSSIKFPLFDLNRLANLKELNIFSSSEFPLNLETLAKNLSKLEHLTLGAAETNNLILPFIRNSKRLKTIKIGSTNTTALDLFLLNQERKKLENACHTSIYVFHKDYLPIKWKSHNFKLELDLIKIVRLEYFDFFEHF